MIVAAHQTMLAPPALPYDAEVEYLESTGTQYVDTGVVPTSLDNIEVEVALPKSLSKTPAFFGSRGATNNGLISWLDSSSFWCYGWGNTSSSNSSFSSSFQTGRIYSFEINSSGIYLDGVKRVTYTDSTPPTTSQSIWIFNANDNGSSYPTTGSYRVYSFSISRNNVLVRSFVPVRVGSGSSAVGYLYDRVSGTLFGNAGTGDFVLGPDTFAQGVVPTRMMAMGMDKNGV